MPGYTVARSLMLVACAALSVISTARSFDYDSYRPITLSGLEDLHPIFLPLEKRDESLISLSAVPFKYRMSVYTSMQVRNISPKRRRKLEMWAGVTKTSPEFLASYNREILIQTEKRSLWVPVQDPVLGHLSHDLPRGGVVDLYVILAGAIDKSWFLLVTEYEQPDFRDR